MCDECDHSPKRAFAGKPVKPVINAHDTDGNVFAVIGAASKALKAKGLDYEAMSMVNEAMSAKDYHNALQIVMKYIDFK